MIAYATDAAGQEGRYVYEGYESVASAPTIFTNDGEIFSENLEVPEVSRADRAYVARARKISVNGANLHVQIAGSGPPMILVNGGPGNSLHGFHPYFEVAERFAQVVYYDQRGVGLSEWNRGDGYTVDQAIEDLDVLREELGFEQVLLLGHSWGGFLSLAYADKHPERVRGLILVGALTRMAGPDESDGQRSRSFMTPDEAQKIRGIYSSGGRVVASHEDGISLPKLQSRIFNGYVNGDWQRQYYFMLSRERMAQVAKYEWVHDLNFNRDMGRDTRSYDLTGRFRERSIPVFVAEGRWDGAWGEGRADAFQTEFPEAKIRVYENSSHNPYRSEPSAFFKDLEEFIDETVAKFD